MGYVIYQEESDFHIRHEDHAPALDALRRWASMKDRISWVSKEDLERARDLSYVLELFGWLVEQDEARDITDLEWESEKIGDDDEMFDAIALYVRAGSYIEMYGEDGARWRWVFDGYRCLRLDPEIHWPEFKILKGGE